MARERVLHAAEPAFDFRPVFHILGYLLCGTGVAMLVPPIVDILAGPPYDVEAFMVSAGLSFGLGILMIMANRGTLGILTLKQTYLLTFLAWLMVSLVAALPLTFSTLEMTVVDAFFETMSGFTTTGSTVLIGLDQMPPNILLWRALVQWIGGLGIMVMAIAILPALRSGGMQLFHTESSDRSDKPLARLSAIAYALCAIYLTLTIVCAVSYRLAGMNGFDAATHAMTTLSTAGYSTHDASFGFFEQPAVLWVGTLFMLIGASPGILFVRIARGELAAIGDRQLHIMLMTFIVVTLVLTLWLATTRDVPATDALRHVAFNVASILSTTGYVSQDYSAWGAFAIGVFFYLMFVGGCTGSTAGGIKIFRLRVLVTVLMSYTKRRFQPHLVTNRVYDGKPLSGDVVEGVMAFVALYFATVAVVAIGCAGFGLDWLTSISGAITAVGNVGPGLGPDIGPVGNFAGLPDGAKWLLAFGMLAGRLELFTVLVVLTPSFWRD